VAPAKTGETAPALPAAPAEAAAPAEEQAAAPKSKKKLVMMAGMGLAALLVLGGGFFAYTKFFKAEPPPAPPPVAKKTPPPAPNAADPAQPGPTPSDTLNAAAKAPVNAVNKAQDVVAQRNATDQAKADSILDPAAQKVAVAPKATPAPAKKESTTTSLGGGVTATTELEVAAEATPAFRGFVANAKVSGVFQGNPPRAFINGKLTRAGETVDSGLGIVFDTIDAEKKLIMFKDRTGATVARKY
jgi:hypothetical protein